MKKNRLEATVVALAASINFGVWQGSFNAGLCMFFFLETFLVIKTVK